VSEKKLSWFKMAQSSWPDFESQPEPDQGCLRAKWPRILWELLKAILSL